MSLIINSDAMVGVKNMIVPGTEGDVLVSSVCATITSVQGSTLRDIEMEFLVIPGDASKFHKNLLRSS